MENMNNWTSVDDRLPEDLQDCAVLRRGNMNPLTGFYDRGRWHVYGIKLEFPITHWMELPEPPMTKAEEQEWTHDHVINPPSDYPPEVDNGE